MTIRPETILIFAANPEDRPHLGLDWEVREIENALRNSRWLFDVRPKFATRPEDLRRALLDHSPAYVHFCGHGEGTPGIVLEGQLVGTDALAELFGLFADTIKCVLLNACYSAVQAKEIARHVDYVIGMNDAIGDRAAIEFAAAFYDALGAGKSVPFAFALGCNAIHVAGLDEQHTPQLVTRRDQNTTDSSMSPTHVHSSRQDWDGAPAVSVLYGREEAAETLRSWILDESCRVVLITGLGGIGKTDLVTCLGRGGNRATSTSPTLADGIQGHFEVVLWRSLLNAPRPVDLFDDLLGVLSDHTHSVDGPAERQLNEILNLLQRRRSLIILDNVEAVLRPGDPSMQYRDGYESYGGLFELVGKATHQSCLLLTSREKPRPISDLEGARKPVRSLTLAGLGPSDSQNIFAQIGAFGGSASEWKQVADLYGGNPLALELVARHVEQVFDGDLGAFLHGGRPLFADLEEVLDWHLQRLGEMETELVHWFAIEREPVSLASLDADLLTPMSRDRLPSTLQSLQRRIPLERVMSRHFTLQPVLIEHVTARLVDQLTRAFALLFTRTRHRHPDSPLDRDAAVSLLRSLNTHALIKASARDNVREAQHRLIVTPIADRLLRLSGVDELRATFAELLDVWREQQPPKPGYAIGNLLHLMSALNIDPHQLDFSRLSIWQASLHDVTLHSSNFAFADFRNTTFRQAFGVAFSIAYTSDGRYIAVGDDNGDVRLFSVETGQLHLRCPGHADVVSCVVFSPDGSLMASASYDNTIRIWNAHDGHCVDILLGHKGWVYSIAFGADNRSLASASEDGTARLWDLQSGGSRILNTGGEAFLAAVAFSPDGHVVAVGGSSGIVHLFRLADLENPVRLTGHTNCVRSLAFSQQGDLLASGAEDLNVLLRRTMDHAPVAVLTGHTGAVMSLSFTPAGDVLASGSNDHTVRLWSSRRGECVGQLHSGDSRIWAVACSPTSRALATACEDSAIRIWNVDTRHRLTTLRGYSNKTWSLAFSPDGRQLAAGNEDGVVRIWDIREGRTPMELRGHTSRVWAVACSTDGESVASASDDLTVRLWDLRTGALRSVMRGHKDWIRGVAFSPDSRFVASAAEDGRIMLWDTATGGLRINIDTRMSRAFAVAFCGTSNLIAVGGADSRILLFSSDDGAYAGSLTGHNAWMSALFPIGERLLGSCSEDGTLRVWDPTTKACMSIFTIRGKIWCGSATADGHTLLTGSDDGALRSWDIGGAHGHMETRANQGSLWSLAVDAASETVATAGDDGLIRLWRLRDLAPHNGANAFRSPRPYEAMNITGATGLTIEQRNALVALGAIEMPSR